jgi:hypothetical protein
MATNTNTNTMNKRSLMNYLFFWGIAIFHLYITFNKNDMAVHARSMSSALPMPTSTVSSGADSKPSGSGCPLRMARSMLSLTTSMLVGRNQAIKRISSTSSRSNVVDLKAGQSVLSYLREQNLLSRYQKGGFTLHATTESPSVTSATSLNAPPPMPDMLGVCTYISMYIPLYIITLYTLYLY